MVVRCGNDVVVGNKITINMLILIIGLPGVGKTTFAKLLQRNLNFEMLSTEE
ncbi:MAG: AAA family ATPase, partial [Saprospiraceae bacterium]